jgi:hypothetical protein
MSGALWCLRSGSRWRWAGALLLGVLAPPVAGAPQGPGAFAFLGDIPYDDLEVARLERVIDQVNGDPGIEFVVHAGDIKSGSSPCDDHTLQARHAQLQRLLPALIYTPGDNEWTDCHRVAAGRFHPLERLARLRQIFFPRPRISGGGRPIALDTQADVAEHSAHVENARWERGQVVFATVHVVGSHNGLMPWSGIDSADRWRQPRPDRVAEVRERERAAVAWLETTFAEARRREARGVFIAMQANPGLELAPSDPGRRGFEGVLATLRRLVAGFGRPVVLAHGDTHRFRVDRPAPFAGDEPAPPNLTRLEGFGSPWVSWVRVTFDAGTPGVFAFEPRRLQENRPPARPRRD